MELVRKGCNAVQKNKQQQQKLIFKFKERGNLFYFFTIIIIYNVVSSETIMHVCSTQ